MKSAIIQVRQESHACATECHSARGRARTARWRRSFVAEGVVRSEFTQTAKAVVREMMGFRAGQPSGSIAVEPSREGLHAVLLALAARLPAPILAERIGIHQARAAQWVRLAGSTYVDHVADRNTI
jgi:hypothetical protein